MGTIGELLGLDPSAFGGSEEQAEESAPVDDAARDEVAEDPRGEAALAALLSVTDHPAERMREDLSLEVDLDLDEVGLWQVVAALEHDLHATFPDTEVRSWHTVGDLLRSARGIS